MSSFAISSEKLVKACQKVGIEKVTAQAEAYDLTVRTEEIKECGVDNRPLNFLAKYVWFCATTTGGEKEIKVITQKPAFKDCF
ncbi:MAG: hypothetical protein NDI69_11110 [Bacteriovoracaceae bacterium]|nr:hypothetical protein [Bacteriovoracaceae bacterium]